MKNCISRLCTGPFACVSHYWWKQPFRVFGMGFDRPSARLQTAKNGFSYPSRHIPSHFFFWLTPEVQRVLKTVLGKVGVSSI